MKFSTIENCTTILLIKATLTSIFRLLKKIHIDIITKKKEFRDLIIHTGHDFSERIFNKIYILKINDFCQNLMSINFECQTNFDVLKLLCKARWWWGLTESRLQT